MVTRTCFVHYDFMIFYWRFILFVQCPNGHTICSSCKHRVDNHCPTFRQGLGNVRCLALEKVAESIQLPCKYQSLGCTEIHPNQNKLKYKELCRFMPCSCPYAGSDCLIVGDVPKLVSHLIIDNFLLFLVNVSMQTILFSLDRKSVV